VLGLLVRLGIVLPHVWTEYRAPGRPEDGLGEWIVRMVVDPSPPPNPGYALGGGVTPPPGGGLALALL